MIKSNTTPESKAEAGKRFLVEASGYNEKSSLLLSHIRFLNGKKAVFKASSKIAAFPRSAPTATQLSYRVLEGHTAQLLSSCATIDGDREACR